jgi:uncharacterized protein (DUF1697 family)
MAQYVALLRGINVGGKNKVAMKALAELFASLGHTQVVTYIQSGNVVFNTAKAAGPVAAALEGEIAGAFGVESPVVLRTKAELAAVAEHNPFLTADADITKLQVTFLDQAPTKEALARLEPDACPPDEFAVRGREIYSRCPNGFGRSKLVPYLERRLPAPRCTTRNWNTVTKLLAMMTDPTAR